MVYSSYSEARHLTVSCATKPLGIFLQDDCVTVNTMNCITVIRFDVQREDDLQSGPRPEKFGNHWSLKFPTFFLFFKSTF